MSESESRAHPPGDGGTDNGGASNDAFRIRDEAQARLAAIIESSDDAIVSKTLDGVVRTWNSGAHRIFGYSAEEMIGQPITKIVPPDRQDEEPQILKRLRAGDRVDHFETVRRRKDGRLIDVSVTISPVRDSTGRIIGASKIARDITEQKLVQRELRAAKEAAEAGSRAKDHFLSVLSHELRTPLTPVLAAMSLMETRRDLPDELREELSMVRRNVETQARLVDDLLDLTRISRGKIELHFEVIDAHAALHNAAGMFRDAMDAKQIEFSTALRAREHFVWADSGRLQQIFLNLMSNAVKFTPAGGRISISSHDAGPELRVEIRDNGAGIDAELLTRLFNPFEQGERTTTRRFGGLGLGLSISRSLLDMHGGTIAAKSPGVGAGSTFTVTMRTVPGGRQSMHSAAGTPAPMPSCRILLVEDHDDTRRVLSKLLTTFGCTVVSASSVAEALKLSNHQDFDVLVSDIGLPDGSGVDLMRQLKATSNIKGVALSGFGQPEDHNRSREAGFATHLTKPINFSMLQEAIRNIAG